MPSRTTCEYCRRRTSSAKLRMSSAWLRMMVGEVSQPSRLRTVAGSPFHRVASFTHRRSRNSRDSRKRSVSSTAGSLSGSGSTGGGTTGADGGAARSGAAARTAAGEVAAAGSRLEAGFAGVFVARAAGLASGLGSLLPSAPGLSGALSAPSSPASSWPILVTWRACCSVGSYWVSMKAWAISRASLTSRPGAARQSTLASASSRAVRAAATSGQRAARIPRILLAAMTPPAPLLQSSRLASTNPRSTACPTARA